MTSLDDRALIQQFIQQQGTLLSNQNLRVEPAFDSAQLLAKRGGLIATIKQTKGVNSVVVRRSSEYWNLVHQVLLEHRFVPLGKPGKSEFGQYEQRQLPAGYKLNCGEARILWKEWWTNARYTSHNSIQVDLLISVRDTWYPIRDVVCSQSMLYVTTLVSEFVFLGTDQVIWLSKLPNQRPQLQAEGHPSGPSAAQSNPASVSNQAIRKQVVEHPALATKEPSQRSVSQQPASSMPVEIPVSKASEDPKNVTVRPDLRQVVEIRQGKLYIMTALGEVVVEGANLKFRLNDDNPAAKKMIHLNNYRDRETHRLPNVSG